MILPYIKHAIRLIKEAPVLSAIAILGTTLTISMVLVFFMVRRVQVEPMYPEVNRDRCLYISAVNSKVKADSVKNYSNGPLAAHFAKEVFTGLERAEAVTIYTSSNHCLTGLPGTALMGSEQRFVDASFWKVHEFEFVSGKPFTEAEFESGMLRAVICQSLARRLFGTSDVAGREFEIDYTTYIISGVVKDVPELCSDSYAELWLPYTLRPQGDLSVMNGEYRVIILAPSSADFSTLRTEIAHRLDVYNNNPANHRKANLLGQPDDYFTHSKRYASNIAPDMKAIQRQYYVTLFILLFVPSINLAAIMFSRMRKRLSEIGVRRSFGASRWKIIMQVMVEGLIQTIISGIAGILLSIVAMFVFRDMLFDSENLSASNISILQLLSWRTLLFAFAICFLINILTTLLPAWRATRESIVTSLTQKR